MSPTKFSRIAQSIVFFGERTHTSTILGASFDPKLTGALLVALLYYPERLQSILPARLRSYVISPAFVRALNTLLVFGVLRKVNRKLSQLALNGWKSNARFVKSQEVVLITGGSSGIGEIMARDFSSKGVKVVVMDINPPKNPFPSNIQFYRVDVTSSSNIAAAASEIRKSYGDPTVLINNAGIGYLKTILHGTEDQIRRTFEVNTISHFLMAKEFLPAMIKKNHGHIVTIASMASYVVHASNVDYSCTKASALAFHEGLAAELKFRYNAPNVRTTVVNPAWIRTPLIEAMIAHPEFKDKVLEPETVTNAVVNQVLSGRSGQIILPGELSVLSTIRAWPSWLQTSFRNMIAPSLAMFDEQGKTAT
ncbi:Short-chain dehydrogenase reductase SDR protein [Rutstroemia sp. NJR-2017a BBW]|nr:Short-chain dehydrogenase reductase SDR protein [Rutstroemia sp. NJR-2017a BBW]